MTCCLLQVCDLQAILRDTNHNGFPVVRDSSVGQICLGLISRAHLLALLQRLIDSYQTGSGRTVSPGTSIPMAASVTMRQQLQQPLMAREVSSRRLLGRRYTRKVAIILCPLPCNSCIDTSCSAFSTMTL